MRWTRILILFGLLSLSLVATPSSKALDICDEANCQPPPAEQNTPYEFHLKGEEGCMQSYHFSYSSGTLPPGLEITDDGRLTGTPTEAGTFVFYVALQDYPGCPGVSKPSQGKFTLVVLPDLAVATASLAPAVVGSPYSVTLEETNPEAGWPLLWDVTQGSLPNGLTLSEGGVISGTPTSPGAQTFTVRVREPFRRSGERELTLTVADKLMAASSSPRVGEVGIRYRGRVTNGGGIPPFAWSVAGGALPKGLRLDQATGTILGVPSAGGTYSAQLGVKDASGQAATVTVNIRIAERLALTTRRLPAARDGESYRMRLAVRGGVGPTRWSLSAGTLPRGLTLGRSTGVLSGVPRAAGTYSFTVRATDRLGASSKRAFRLVVR